MQRILLTSCFLILVSVGFSQEFLFEIKPAGFSTNSAVMDVVELSNGNAMFLIENSDNFSAAELDQAGSIMQAMDFSEGSNNDMEGIAAMSDGKVLQFGSYGYTRRAGFVIRDSTGTVLKDTFLRESSWAGAPTYLYDAVVDKEDNIYFVGHIYDIYSGGVSFYSWRIPFVGKLNSDLEMQWVKTYSSHNSSNKRKGSANNITFAADSNLLVFGTHSQSTNSSTKRDYIAKVSPAGSTIWAKEIQPNFASIYSAKLIRSFADGSFCVVRNKPDGQSITKFDSNGSLIWNRTLSHDTYSFNITDMQVSASGMIYLAANLYSNDWQGVLVRMDSSGAILNASLSELNPSWSTHFSSLVIMSDNHLTVGGASNDIPIAIRTDSVAFGPCGSDSLTLEVDTVAETWNTATNLSGKGMVYYNYAFSNDTALACTTDTTCFFAPACDVTASFSLNDSVLCEGEVLSVQSTATGTGLDIHWLLDSSLLLGNSIDTVLTTGAHTLIQISEGAYCKDTVSQNIYVSPTYLDTMTQNLCSGDTFFVGSQTYFSDTTFADSLLTVSGCDSVTIYQLTFEEAYTALYDSICALDTFWFGSNPLHSTGVYFDTLSSASGCDSVVELNLHVRSLSGSSSTVSACDSFTWSVNMENYYSSGIYHDTLTNVFGCDSVITLDLTINYTTAATQTELACDSFEWSVSGMTYYASGLYLDTLTNIAGCDSVVALDLTLNQSSLVTQTEVVCDSYTWPLNAQTYTSSGVYLDTLMNSTGCDSVIQLNLTVNYSNTGTQTEVACDSYTWPANAQTYTSSGTYQATLTNAAGCDSVVTLNLTVNQSNSGTQTEVACDSYTWSANAQTFTSSGTYQATLTNAAGCDSVVTLNLTVNQSNTGSQTEVACDSYTWSANAQTYTSSGTYQATLTNAAGCDSVVTLNLTVNQSNTGTQTEVACDSYTWLANAQTYTSSGTYQATLTNAAGCDSVVTLNLTVNQSNTGSQTEVACDSYTWPANAQTYTSSGTYQATLTNAAGCDSVVTLNLTVNQSNTGSQTEVTCDSYTWPANAQTYTSSGTYQATLTNAAGCDSVVTLNLTINQSSTGTQTEIACDSFSWNANGLTYYTSGTYLDTLTNASGCDSIVTLNLTVHNSNAGTQVEVACDDYLWSANGQSYTTSGMYVDTLVNALGCDSLVTLDLTVNYSNSGSQAEEACESYTWPANAQFYTSSGTYTTTLTNSQGCDSIATLNLTITEVDTGVIQNGIILTSEAVFAQYQWLDCNDNYSIISGATDATFTPVENGYYAVQVTQGQCVDTSKCQEVIGVGIGETVAQGVKLYPNPSRGLVTIKFDDRQMHTEVRVLSATGRFIQSYLIEERDQIQLTIDQPSGLYFVTLDDGLGQVEMIPFIIQ